MTRFRPPAHSVQPEAAEFWSKGAKGEIWLPRCTDCARLHFYPRNRCPHCGGAALAWEQMSGAGTLHSFTIVRRPFHPYFREMVPYVPALVMLDEQVILPARAALGEDEFDRLTIGCAVRVAFDAGETGQPALVVTLP